MRTRALAPEDVLLHVCVHADKWASVPGIRWVADSAMILRGGAVDWDRLFLRAQRCRFVKRLTEQLTYLREAFDLAIPESFLARLSAAPVSRLERFETVVGFWDRRRFTGLTYWYFCLRRADGFLSSLPMVPRYIQASWGLDSMSQIVAHAPRHLIRRLRYFRKLRETA